MIFTLFFIGIVQLEAEKLRPINMTDLLDNPVVKIEEYQRDLDFENTIAKRNSICIPDHIDVEKFRDTFNLSKNLYEQCFISNMNQEQALKYTSLSIAAIIASAVSGGVLAPAFVGYFQGEVGTDLLKCSTKALVGTLDSLDTKERDFIFKRINEIASLEDWEGFIGSSHQILEGVNKIKGARGTVEAYLAVLERGGEASDFVSFLSSVYGIGERYVKDQIYGKVENYFKDSQKAKDQCQFEKAEHYLKDVRKVAEENCREAGKWFRHTEARLEVKTSDRAFREYWRRLLNSRFPNPRQGDDMLLRDYEKLKNKTFVNSKTDLDKSSQNLLDVISKIQSRRDLIHRRENAFDKKKHQINTSIDKMIKTLDNQDYEAACEMINDPALSKSLSIWSPECRLQFRNDNQDPLDILRDIEHKINDQSAKISKQIILLVDSAIADINSCLLSNLNRAQGSLKMADELSSKLLLANNYTCRKSIPYYVSQKLSEGYKVLKTASPHVMEAFLKEIDAGIQPARKALRDCEGMNIFTDLKKMKAKLEKKRCQGTRGISMRLKEIEFLQKTIDPKNCFGEIKKECDIMPSIESGKEGNDYSLYSWLGSDHASHCLTANEAQVINDNDETWTSAPGDKCVKCSKGFTQGLYNGSKVCIMCPKEKHYRNGCCR